MKNSVKLNHRVFRKLIATHHMTQEKVARELEISDRHVRNLCTNDTDAAVSLCYRISELFGTKIEELLIVQEETA